MFIQFFYKKTLNPLNIPAIRQKDVKSSKTKWKPIPSKKNDIHLSKICLYLNLLDIFEVERKLSRKFVF
jgi:hypothetical protein